MATANHVLLRRITLSASAASVTFDSIPQTGYTDLKIVASPRVTSGGGQGQNVLVRFNGDTGNNYSFRALEAYSGSYVQSYSGTSVSRGLFAGSTTDASTANTFGNTEIYIPNYTSSSQKSFTGDAWAETNAAASPGGIYANLWTGTAAISSITVYSNADWAAGSSFSLYGIADVNTTPALAPKADGGDIIKTDGTYWYHAFLSTGSFRPQLNLTCDVVAVAGGGAGGNSYGGGGGAGGVIYFTNQSVASSAATTVTVGAGGAGFTGGTVATGANGSNSTFGALAAAIGGGGGGGYAGAEAGRNGGSGGGGSRATAGGGSSTQTGTGATAYYGNAGGGVGSSNQCAGGGGAGAAGTAGGSTTGGNGGNGTSAFSSWLSTVGVGQNVSGTWYIAGGGSGNGTGAWGVGGYGGGGDGSISKLPTVNCGGGGFDSNVSGSSGVVIIRYPVA